METLHEIKLKIQERLKIGGIIKITEGAFGDLPNCAGMVEEIIDGKNTKFFGCSYLFKGNPDYDKTKEMGLAKAMISVIPREIIMRSFLFKISIIFMALFARRRLYHYAWVYFGSLRRHSFVNFIGVEPVSEIRRALKVALVREGWSGQFSEDYYLKGNLIDALANVSEFLFFFLENDVAYRFPLQDILGNLNKENVKKSVYSEVKRLFDLLIERAKCGHFYNLRKWIFLKKMVMWSLFIPQIRRILKNFLLELDISKVALDEDDWYFCLARGQYNYGGLSLNERLKEKNRIDKEKKHIILEFKKVNEGKKSSIY